MLATAVGPAGEKPKKAKKPKAAGAAKPAKKAAAKPKAPKAKKPATKKPAGESFVEGLRAGQGVAGTRAEGSGTNVKALCSLGCTCPVLL